MSLLSLLSYVFSGGLLITTRRTEPFDEDMVVKVPKPVEALRSQGRGETFDLATRPWAEVSRARRPVTGKRSCILEENSR